MTRISMFRATCAATTLGLLAMSSAVAAAALAVDHDYDGYATPTVAAKVATGRTIALYCVGNGSPTVVRTAGAGDWASTWRKVQGQIGKTTRACAWDRAGFGFSSPSNAVQDVVHTEADLEAALSAAKIAGPYVLVGHSLGSYETMLFADRRPKDVVGIVLVDPSFPDQFRVLTKAYPDVAKIQLAIQARNIHDMGGCIAGVRSGAMKHGNVGWADCTNDDPAYPAALRQRLSRLADDPRRLETQLSYTKSEIADGEMVINAHRHYGIVPLTILTAQDTPDLPEAIAPKATIVEMKAMQAHGWVEGHDQMAALSSRGRNVIVAGTTHYIQLIKPDTVTEATTQVVQEARVKPVH